MKNITHNSFSFLAPTIRLAAVAVTLGVVSIAQAGQVPADDTYFPQFDGPAQHIKQAPRQSQVKKSSINRQRATTGTGNRHSFLTPGGYSVQWAD
ncbi:MAG TPA: hypothetical protein VK970_03745 [Candidatus Methylacidiphilales bacterium]|nr:hypothetical protein [Candidatus Methylacidiphilales bacterium]